MGVKVVKSFIAKCKAKKKNTAKLKIKIYGQRNLRNF